MAACKLSLVGVALGVTLVASAPGCARMAQEGDFEEIGLVGASSEPPPGLLHPVAPADLVAVHDRGRLLHQHERALVLAYEQGMHQVGDPGTDAVLPLVDVDPGGRSAQVLFVRWPLSSDGQLPPLRADSAERWLVVSMLLSPDRILDVEILAGGVPKGSHVGTRIDSLIAAAERARQLAEGTVFHLYDLYEEVPIDPEKPIKGSQILAHVYALAADPGGPDLELFVAPPHRRHEASIRGGFVVHEAGATLEDPLRVQTDNPGPLTVARAMQRGDEAGSIAVQTPKGSWTIVARTGLLARQGADSPREP